MARLTQARIDKAVKAVAATSGAAQVIIDPDGTIRVVPVEPGQAYVVTFDKKAPVDL